MSLLYADCVGLVKSQHGEVIYLSLSIPMLYVSMSVDRVTSSNNHV